MTLSHLVEDRNDLLNAFIEYGMKKDAPRVLEMGTFRSNPAVSTMHQEWFPHASAHLGTDFQAGVDVDITADAHELSKSVEPGSIDLLLSCSVFEHLQKPWIVAEEMVKVLAPGGALFIQTHQSFPLHGYPQDFWRFTREAMEVMFTPSMGLHSIQTCYQFPAQVVSVRDPGGKDHPAFLNVCLVAYKH
jgi:hypothetical protein